MIGGERGDRAQDCRPLEIIERAADAFGPGAAWFETVEDLIAEARRSLHADVAVLVKGSRANRLERVTQALAQESSEVS